MQFVGSHAFVAPPPSAITGLFTLSIHLIKPPVRSHNLSGLTNHGGSQLDINSLPICTITTDVLNLCMQEIAKEFHAVVCLI